MSNQAEIVDFLAGLTSERVETHISSIFLAENRVYKLKKAVTLPYVDFSSLEARRKACEAEIALNRRTAPMLYRHIAAVTRESDGSLALGGAGEVLDWVVEMNRFDQDQQLDRVALDKDLVQELADAVVSLHAVAEATVKWGGYEGLSSVVEGNRESFLQAAPGIFAESEIEALTARSRAELDRHHELLEERRRSGKVRRCHGDLHLGNICLIGGRPVLFDAIEFSDSIACIDVFYDLAFLVMDLDRKGFGEFAALLLSRWLAATDDFAALPLLPLMLSLRAAIRSHIVGVTSRSDEARSYFLRAEAYLCPKPPRLVAVGGLSGTGKSHLARKLAPLLGAAPGAVVLRSDVLRKHLMGVSPETRLPPSAYGEAVTEKVYGLMMGFAEQALRAGQSVIVDAVSARPRQRADLSYLAARLGVPFAGLWLEAEAEDLKRRIEERRNNASDATIEVLDRQLDYDLGPMDWARIDSSGPKERTVEKAREVLNV